MNNYFLTDNLTDAKTFVAEIIGAHHLHFTGANGITACWEVVAGGRIEQSGRIYEYADGALLDRLTHHVHILEMNGESFRLKHSRKHRKTQA